MTVARIMRCSVITCPHCRVATPAEMPVDACQWFFDCPGCGAVLRPRPGDCCVFCSYGSVPCPPVQAGGTCCSTMPATGKDEG